ncbi:MAG: ABC transporter permease [Acidobacteriota bacterium]|nr:ABC transporter permease [Acidobacteriota bacterium]MDH3525127.1 ABC transporter permease [Acidobacteriota bacterium]
MTVRPWIVFQLFLRSSRVQKKRAILTVAAIAWGSLSLVLLLAFGEGLKRQLTRAQAGMGRDIAVLWPGETTMPWQGLPAGRPVRPRLEDVELVASRVEHLAGALGEMTDYRAPVTYGRKTVNVRLTGVSLPYGELRNHMARDGGRFFNVLDEGRRRRVIFLGWTLAEDLFGDEDPVGRTLLVANVPYLVVGVLVEKLQMGAYGGPDEDHAVIPITTFKTQFGRERLSNLVVGADGPEHMPQVLREVREVLAAKYGFDPEDERALPTWDTVESSAIMQNMLLGIQLFLGIIGGLTLFAGGIGVANIMYAVVKERTREIGVKMALGARSSWITGPLILEGLTYTLMGGALGLIMATGLIALLDALPTGGNEALEFLGKPTLSLPIALATAAILGLIGLLAAYFPARRAALVDPAETLRYE